MIFSATTYVLLDGEEKSETLVTVLTVTYFVIMIISSLFFTRKIHYFLSRKNLKTNIIYLAIVGLTLCVTMLFLNIGAL